MKNCFIGRSMDKKRVILILVLLFAAVYYIGRLGIFYVGVTGDMAFEEPQSQLVENVVSASFLVIGVVGLLMLPGVYLSKTWGFWGMIAVSAYTMVFDIWAGLFVQSSAAAGIIPAAVIVSYLLVTRKDYVRPR